MCEYTRTDYEKFQRTLQKLPFALFQEFDKDDDLSLTPSEAAAITDRFCVALPNRTLLDTDGDGAITPQEYGHWLGNYEVDVDGPDFATSPRSREEVIDYYHSKLDDSSLTRKVSTGAWVGPTPVSLLTRHVAGCSRDRSGTASRRTIAWGARIPISWWGPFAWWRNAARRMWL